MQRGVLNHVPSAMWTNLDQMLLSIIVRKSYKQGPVLSLDKRETKINNSVVIYSDLQNLRCGPFSFPGFKF